MKTDLRTLTPDLTAMTRADRGALWGIAGLIAVIALIAPTVGAVLRVAQYAAGSDVALALDMHPAADADVTPIAAEAVVDLTGREQALLIVGEIAGALAWAVAMGCVVALLVSIARGVAFSRANAWRMYGAALSMILGYGIDALLSMIARSEVAMRLGYPYTVHLELDMMQLLIVPIVFVSFAVILGAGTRMQRDTEGLI